MRKNLNYTIKCNRYNEYPGVDLNRNYDFKFGTDNIGSSDDPCSVLKLHITVNRKFIEVTMHFLNWKLRPLSI